MAIKFKCFSLGVGVDGGLFNMFTGGHEIGLGFSLTSSNTLGYYGLAGGGGLHTALPGGPEMDNPVSGGLKFGFWRGEPKALAGAGFIASFGLAGLYGSAWAGFEVSVIFNIGEKSKINFLGFQITCPNMGDEIELTLTAGNTWTF